MTREEYIEKTKKVFNHIGILNDTEIVRCIGFAEDDEDYYWIVVSPERSLVYSSMVGGFVSLKDLNYPRYEYMEMAMNDYWGCPREKEFIIEKI